MKGSSIVRAAVLLALGATSGSLAQAQQTGQPAAQQRGVLEEITVTAQRREQSVQDIPLAVSAFSEADMSRLQITQTLDLVRLIPNMVGHNNTGPGNSNAYFLRGLGNTESIATFDPPVGTYVDDVYISRQSANNYALFDVERIEVLRGPQGTLFGRNTTGGAVNVITKKPGEELSGMVEGSWGSFNHGMLRGSIDIPFSEQVLTKFSGFYQEHDGFVTSTATGEKINPMENYGVRGAVRFLPSDLLTWDLSGEWVYLDGLNPIRSLTDSRTNASGLSRSKQGGTLLEQLRNGGGQRSETESLMFISNAQLDFDAVSLQFITGYRDENWKYIIDFINSGVPGVAGFAIANEQDTEQFTQEIKAVGTFADDRIRYTSGVFYIREKNTTDFQDVAGTNLLLDRVMDNSMRSIAGYLQLDFSVGDDWTFSAGGRYTRENKDIAYVSRNDRGGLFNISTQELIDGGVPVEQSFTRFTPRFALEYQETDNRLWFISATNGFKSGGWNARGAAPHVAGSYLPFGPEKVWSYEAGLRSEWLDSSLRANVTVFWAEVEDLQLISGIPNPAGAGVLFLTQNTGEGRYRGVESEFRWLPTDNLSLFASVGLMEAEYTSIVPQPGQTITTDTKPVRSPDVTGNIGAVYAIPAPTLGGEFTIGGDATYIGTHWTSAANTPPASYVSPRFIYQAQLGYTSNDGAWSAALACKNCGDKQYVTSWFLGPYFNNPRTWDVRLAYRF
ncbi:MAG: TonB-dependent receptor [Gammaproteobacteria bacterium]|nr:TonB-dependent receptor [Gammaproteobacteria bacterium]